MSRKDRIRGRRLGIPKGCKRHDFVCLFHLILGGREGGGRGEAGRGEGEEGKGCWGEGGGGGGVVGGRGMAGLEECE